MFWASVAIAALLSILIKLLEFPKKKCPRCGNAVIWMPRDPDLDTGRASYLCKFCDYIGHATVPRGWGRG